MNPKVISEEPMNMATVKAELDRIRKRDTDLNFRANKTDEYLQQSVTIKKKEADELFKKLTDANIPRIKDMHVHKIIDVMPQTPEEVKSVLSAYNISLSADNLKKIIDEVSEYLPKKK